MKGKLRLLVALAAMLAIGQPASAVELKVKGEYRADFSWTDNVNFRKTGDGDNGDGVSEDDFEARQRMRLRFAFVANENLHAVLHLEAGDSVWGRPNDGADLGADDRVIEVKNAYLDFNWPGSEVNVKVGVQDVSLPWSGYFEGSHVLSEDAAGMLVSVPFTPTFALTYGWTRLWDNNSGNGQNDSAGQINTNAAQNVTARNDFDETDVVFFALPITPEGMKVTPYLAYAVVSKDVANTGQPNGSALTTGRLSAVTGLYQFTESAIFDGVISDGDNRFPAWWAGLAFELTMFDPFVFYFDFVYGAWKQDGLNGALPAQNGRAAVTLDSLETRGFIVDAALKYKGWDFATPELFFAYASGNKADAISDGRLGVMPFVLDDAWTPTGVSYWGGTDFSGNQADLGAQNLQGHWTVGVALRGFSFLDKLTHDLIVSYIRGTSSSEFVKEAIDRGLMESSTTEYGFNRLGVIMSTKDAIWTVDFNHAYEVYEQLSAHVEMSTWIPDFDEDVWNGSTNRRFADDQQTAYKLLLGMRYRF